MFLANLVSASAFLDCLIIACYPLLDSACDRCQSMTCRIAPSNDNVFLLLEMFCELATSSTIVRGMIYSFFTNTAPAVSWTIFIERSSYLSQASCTLPLMLFLDRRWFSSIQTAPGPRLSFRVAEPRLVLTNAKAARDCSLLRHPHLSIRSQLLAWWLSILTLVWISRLQLIFSPTHRCMPKHTFSDLMLPGEDL